jgi:hypothetical protein
VTDGEEACHGDDPDDHRAPHGARDECRPQAPAVPLAVTDDAAAARAAFRNELTRYAALPFYRAMMQASGLGEALRAFDRDGTVPESMAAALGGVGDAPAARAYLQSYRQAGVTLPAVRPITFPDAPWYRRTLEEAASW